MLSFVAIACSAGTPGVDPLVRDLSARFCPASSHGLFSLHADHPAAKENAEKILAQRAAGTHASSDCVDPPLPATWLCIYPPGQDYFISAGIAQRGHWSSACNDFYRTATLCAIAKAVRGSGVPRERAWVLDIGANIGTFTLPLLAAGINVLSVEADADNLSLLNGSLAAQRHMRPGPIEGPKGATPLGTSVLVGAALAATAGEQICMGRAQRANSGSVTQLANQTGCQPRVFRAGAWQHQRLVHTTTLDEAIAGLERTAGLAQGGAVFVAMKIDVQGSEAAVLAGATRLLDRRAPPKVYIETQNSTLLDGLVRDHGYKQLNRVDTRRGRSHAGCDFNVRLERESRQADGVSGGAASDGSRRGAAGRKSTAHGAHSPRSPGEP